MNQNWISVRAVLHNPGRLRVAGETEFAESFRPRFSYRQTGKTTAIRRIAGRETGVSRHQKASLRPPLKPPVHHITIVLRGIRSPTIVPPRCPERRQSHALTGAGLQRVPGLCQGSVARCCSSCLVRAAGGGPGTTPGVTGIKSYWLMGIQFSALLQPLDTILLWWSRGFRVPVMPREASFLDRSDDQ